MGLRFVIEITNFDIRMIDDLFACCTLKDTVVITNSVSS